MPITYKVSIDILSNKQTKKHGNLKKDFKWNQNEKKKPL